MPAQSDQRHSLKRKKEGNSMQLLQSFVHVKPVRVLEPEANEVVCFVRHPCNPIFLKQIWSLGI